MGRLGTMSIDSGHEMYIPAVLSQGKQLYRDVLVHVRAWLPLRERISVPRLRIHLNVLYWAGSLAAWAARFFFFLLGSNCHRRWQDGRLGRRCDRGLPAVTFSFPLPYTFASVYGCLVGCAFLWLAVRAVRSTH